MSYHPYTRLFPKNTDPTVTDDETSTPPHEVGDFWINILTGDVFQAVDVTAGAAVWSTGGGGVGFNDAEGDPATAHPTTASDGTSSYAARRDHVHRWDFAGGILAGTLEDPVDGDHFGYRDVVTSNTNKVTWSNLKALLKTYFDTLYAVLANGVTNGDSHDHNGGDGAQINHTTLSNIGTNSHATIDTYISTTAPATFAPIAKGVTNGDSHNHVGGDGAVLYHTDVLGAFLNSVSVPASTTYHGCPFKIGADATTNSFPWPEAGDLTDMTLRIGSGQPATGSLVCTLFVNNVASTLVITIAAGSAGPANFSDTTHTVTIAANDILRWVIQNNATSGSGTLTAVSMKLKKPTT